MPFLASEGCFWPPTASMTSEAKNNYAYVTTQGICNNFIEIKFSVGCIVWLPNRLFQDWTSFGLLIRYIFSLKSIGSVGLEINNLHTKLFPNFSAQFQAWYSTICDCTVVHTAQLCLGMFVFHLQFFLFGIFLSVFFENKTKTQIESVV